ncbi:hypothetical protein Pla110_02900 [Polystyrenella longa]|uniref:Uncharacterized protein n=1 Tax=Polystyrenella longa TaxID=2528007 RepID=A0A518CH84_9PLAN|nr:hypothetical protein [Polystyrenella longa]QDU78586.1 hypothetical protein Pla110_02900 [Polystyrenella longa]
MAPKLNKKQKKQIDALRTKIQKAQVLLTAAKKQPDDPSDITRLQKEIDDHKQQIETIQSTPG